MIKINGKEVVQDHFGDGTLKINFEVDNEPIIIDWVYENDAELFTLICVKRHIDNSSVCFPTSLVMNYLPHARQDRVKNPSDVFTLKYFCEVINALCFSQVIILDGHSNVGPALLNRCINTFPEEHIKKAINKEDNNVVLFFPDEGAMKRYSTKFPNYKYAFGIKKRNWETGRIEGLEIIHPENIQGKNVLIIDDICSYGNTFVMSAKALREAGATRVALYITHAENNIIKGGVFSAIDKVYTTDSLIHTREVRDKIEYV